MANILIVDDDPQIRDLLTVHLKGIDQIPMAAETLADAIDMLTSGDFDLVFLDVNLPDGNGLESLSMIKSVSSQPEVIIITAEGSSRGAEMAIESGAWDYILKPLCSHEIKLNVKRSLEYRASRKAMEVSPEAALDRSSIIGSSPKLISKLNMVSQCAKSDANVLITGQTGTGKELFANVIHKNSRQNSHHFVVVDCASLPEQLVESVLFGHVKGAYTGADSNQDGLIIKADGGTLFLDEIGELSLSIQKKFLRVLQERKFKPVGGTKEYSSNFRLISATNKNLDQMVIEKQFRSDLLFRLKTFHIDLPSLKECKEDIKDLTLHYIYELCRQYGFENKGFVPEFLNILESYDWPGNTRELISSLEKAIISDPESQMLYPNCLPNNVRLSYMQSSIDLQQGNSKLQNDQYIAEASEFIRVPKDFFEPIKDFKQVKSYITGQAEKMYLQRLIRLSNGDLDEAASLSNLSKAHVYSLLKKHNVTKSE